MYILSYNTRRRPVGLGARALQLRLRSALSALRPPALAQLLKKSRVLRQTAFDLLVFGAYGSLGGPFGLRFRSIFGRFRGRAGVLTKNVRHEFRLRHGECIACRGLREGPENRPKIAPGASRERRSEKIAQKMRLESARAPFLTDLARFGLVFGSSWVSFASFFVSRASPGVLRARPGSPRITPEAPRTLPERSGVDFGSVFAPFSVVFGVARSF